MTGMRNFRRGAGILVLGAGIAWLGACDAIDDLLKVSNPSQLQEEQADDPALAGFLVNSVAGAMVGTFDYSVVWVGQMFTDESVLAVNWEATARLGQRIVQYYEGDANNRFAAFHNVRAMADSVAGRFRNGMISNASSDWRMAFALAYAGYGYIFLADIMCESTIDVSAKIYQPLELYEIAVERFAEALQVAQAANHDQLANLARVGLARAHLNLGNYAQVQTYASQVAPGFKWWVQYAGDDNLDAPGNNMFTNISGANHRIGVHPVFLAGGPGNWMVQNLEPFLTDPRLQHWPRWRTGHNALSPLYTPYQTLRYSGYNGETIATGGQPAAFTRGDDVLLADELEAKHLYWEAVDAQGANPTGVLAFVNERRAAGNQDPVSLSGKALTMELRQQKGIDTYLGGIRNGDLRRWLRGGDDMFPSGTHPTEEWGQYGDATCFPLPSNEYDGNPNINRPR
jgi:tetratricopeptide (TPR) repeat protein